jgi:hypothetical protein
MLTVLLLASCSDFNPKNPNSDFGKLKFQFSHDVKADTFNYINAAGNKFMISEIQYFISDIKLFTKQGDTVLLDKYEDIHYVDTDIPNSFIYAPGDSIPVGDYEKMSFTFGINEKKNKSMLFVNPPESFMFWPAVLGGGYHYMKLNGKWIDPEGNPKVFNFHLGIGQEYNVKGEITAYNQNYFEVNLANSSIQIRKGQMADIEILMQVENWFRNPNTWDFNTYGGKIMQNQEAVSKACSNGHDVFKIQSVNYQEIK